MKNVFLVLLVAVAAYLLISYFKRRVVEVKFLSRDDEDLYVQTDRVEMSGKNWKEHIDSRFGGKVKDASEAVQDIVYEFIEDPSTWSGIRGSGRTLHNSTNFPYLIVVNAFNEAIARGAITEDIRNLSIV